MVGHTLCHTRSRARGKTSVSKIGVACCARKTKRSSKEQGHKNSRASIPFIGALIAWERTLLSATKHPAHASDSAGHAYYCSRQTWKGITSWQLASSTGPLVGSYQVPGRTLLFQESTQHTWVPTRNLLNKQHLKEDRCVHFSTFFPPFLPFFIFIFYFYFLFFFFIFYYFYFFLAFFLYTFRRGLLVCTHTIIFGPASSAQITKAHPSARASMLSLSIYRKHSTAQRNQLCT